MVTLLVQMSFSLRDPEQFNIHKAQFHGLIRGYLRVPDEVPDESKAKKTAHDYLIANDGYVAKLRELLKQPLDIQGDQSRADRLRSVEDDEGDEGDEGSVVLDEQSTQVGSI